MQSRVDIVRILTRTYKDPLIRKRIPQLLVAFSTTVLDKNTGFMLKVLEHILMTWPAPQPEHKLFNDAIKDLQTESVVELQRLASKMPDHLIVCYDPAVSAVKPPVLMPALGCIWRARGQGEGDDSIRYSR